MKVIKQFLLDLSMLLLAAAEVLQTFVPELSPSEGPNDGLSASQIQAAMLRNNRLMARRRRMWRRLFSPIARWLKARTLAQRPVAMIVVCIDERIVVVIIMGETRRFYMIGRVAGSAGVPGMVESIKLAIKEKGVKVVWLLRHVGGEAEPGCAMEGLVESSLPGATDGYQTLSRGMETSGSRGAGLLKRLLLDDGQVRQWVAEGKIILSTGILSTDTREVTLD